MILQSEEVFFSNINLNSARSECLQRNDLEKIQIKSILTTRSIVEVY